MRNLLLFFARFYSFFLFLFFEIIAINFIVNKNHYQRSVFTQTLVSINGKISKWQNGVNQYFGLVKKNFQVAEYNARLQEELFNLRCVRAETRDTIRDTTIFQTYSFQPAKVVNNTIYQKHNFITIDKGANQGVKPEMGIIGPQGVVGVVIQTSPNFSRVISLLNKNFQVSARLKTKNYIGSLSWNGNNPLYAQLSEIARHVPVAIGDTIVTTGFSTLFPEGIMLGFVNKKESQEGANFYNIEVKLSTDFSKIDQIYIVDYLLKEEKQALEKEGQDE